MNKIIIKPIKNTTKLSVIDKNGKEHIIEQSEIRNFCKQLISN